MFVWKFSRGNALVGDHRTIEACLPGGTTSLFILWLAVQPGVARAFVLHSTLNCRFAPVAPHSVLASQSIAQPTDDPIEKLCSALNFCWLKKKKPFSNGKRHAFLATSSPGGSLPFSFSRTSSPCYAETRFVASPCSLCLSFNPCRWPAGSLCWWRLPSIQNSDRPPIVTFDRKVNDRDRELGRTGKVLSELEQLQRACSSYWRKKASKLSSMTLTVYAGSFKYDRYVDG